MPRRPAVKPRLTRNDFVAVALDIIAESSVDQLSMRKVAARLDVSAMAMYKHFPNKEALLSAALDAFIAEADVIPKASLRWDKWVESVAREMYRALCRDMSWVPFLGAIRLGEQAMQVTDSFVKKLTDAGFPVEQALSSYFTMIQLVIGAVCMRSSLAIADKDTSANPEATAKLTSPNHLNTLKTSGQSVAPALDTIVRQEPLDISLPFFMASLREQFSNLAR